MNQDGAGRTAPEIVSLALLVFLAAVTVYRARTQSITIDEASSYIHFVSGPISRVFATYDATNHVLQSALSWMACKMFGVSEFTLRLPAVLAAFAYFTVAFRMSRYLFGSGWLLLLSVATLCLNPFVLDYLTAARGYGLALAFFLFAFYRVLRRFTEPEESGHLTPAGIALGLSVASNLVFLYPAVALTATALAMLMAEAILSRKPGMASRSFWECVDGLVVPSIVVAFVFLAVPLTRADKNQFYYGARSLPEMSESVVVPALFHHQRIWTVLDSLHWQQAPRRIAHEVVPVFAAWIGAAWVWTVIRATRGSAPPRPARDAALLLSGGALAGVIVLLLASHYAFRIPLPLERTFLYAVPLAGVACLAIVAGTGTGRAAKVLAAPVLAALALSAVLYAFGFSARYFYEWRFDADNRAVVNAIRQRQAAEPKTGVRVGATWLLEPSLNFYRIVYGLGWMEEVRRDDFKGEYDYYVLLREHHSLIRERGLIPIHSAPFSGAIVAVARSRRQ